MISAHSRPAVLSLVMPTQTLGLKLSNCCGCIVKQNRGVGNFCKLFTKLQAQSLQSDLGQARTLRTRSLRQRPKHSGRDTSAVLASSSVNAPRNPMAQAAASNQSQQYRQNLDFLLVLDFEATCDNPRQIKPQEIIEFPVLKLNVATCQVDSTFHCYVQPQYNPELSTFCTQLTGIIQDMVDGQPYFPEVYQRFHEWMMKEGLLDQNVKSSFLTCGDWDLKTMLPTQLGVSGLEPRFYFKNWVNIKKSYAEMTSVFPKGMMQMLTDLQLKHVGRHHSGIDDCTNIANIAVEMIRRGYIFRQNGSLRPEGFNQGWSHRQRTGRTY